MNESTGKLVLRITLGVLVLLHGISKLRGGIGWLDGTLEAAGLPAFLKYGVYVGEVLAPLAASLTFTRPGSPRARSPSELPALIGPAGRAETSQPIDVIESVTDAFSSARNRASRDGGWVVVCGSLYLVGDIRACLLTKVGSKP